MHNNYDVLPPMAHMADNIFDGSNTITINAQMHRPEHAEIDAANDLRLGVYAQGDFAFIAVASNLNAFFAQLNTKKISHTPLKYNYGTVLQFNLIDSGEDGISHTTTHLLPDSIIDSINAVLETQMTKQCGTISFANEEEELNTCVMQMLRSSKAISLQPM